MSGVIVVQITAVRARTRCRTRPRTQAGVCAVAFEVDLVLQGIEDRFDGLQERFENGGART